MALKNITNTFKMNLHPNAQKNSHKNQTNMPNLKIQTLDCSPSVCKANYKNLRTSSPIQSPTKCVQQQEKQARQASIAHIHKLQEPNQFIKKHQKKANLNINGRLKIALYNNCGLLTVHIIQARSLQQTSSERCDSYVRVTMLPDYEARLKCQTSIIKDTNNPIYDEKFSFEFSQEDFQNRLLIQVWQKCYFNCTDYLIGCFSFKIKHLMKNTNICAWYYLLGDYQIGAQKHYKCKTHSVKSQVTSEREQAQQPSVTDVNKDIIGLNRLKLDLERNSDYGFGFTVTGSCPCIVGKVDPEKLAFAQGLRPGDYIVKIGDKNVSRASFESVVKLIKNCKSKLQMEIYREKQAINSAQLYFNENTSANTNAIQQMQQYIQKQQQQYQSTNTLDKKSCHSGYSGKSGKSIELPLQYLNLQCTTATTGTMDSDLATHPYVNDDDEVSDDSECEDDEHEIPYVDEEDEDDVQIQYYHNIARTRAPLIIKDNHNFNGLNPQFV